MKQKKTSFYLPAVCAAIVGCFGSYTFQFIGTLRFGEVFALVCLVLMISSKAFARAISDKDVLYPILAIGALVALQLISDIRNFTDLFDIYKGNANFAFATTSFLFLTIVFRDRINVVIVYLIAKGIGALLFRDLFQTSEEILSNEYWDLRVGFWAAPFVQAAALIFVRKARWLVVAGLLVYGAAAITYGGRSHGMIYAFAALALILTTTNIRTRISNVSQKQITRGLIASVLFATVFFPVYVNLGLSGVITKKAQSQLRQLDNPYNPIEVLLAGRYGIQHGINALKKRPFIGYGSRAYRGDYLVGSAGLNDRNPIHSMIFECFAFGGIFVGLAYLTLMYFTLKRCFNMFALLDYRCVMIAAVVLITFSWISLASPLASFRLSWPSLLAMTFAFDLKPKMRPTFLPNPDVAGQSFLQPPRRQ